jgi:hypothetical protein
MREIAKHHSTLADTHRALGELYNEEADRLDEDFDLE